MRNSRLEGVKFGLFDNCGRQICSGCTNRNGEIDFEGLPMGRYSIKQLSRSSEFESGSVCKEVIIDCNGRCKIVDFENVQRLGGIRVQLFGRTEHCTHFVPDCNNSCNRSCGQSCCEQSSCDNTWQPDCGCNSWNN